MKDWIVSCCPSVFSLREEEELASVNAPLLAASTRRSFSRWMIAFILVTVVHLLYFAAYSFIDIYSLMTRDDDAPPWNDTSSDPHCHGITEIPISLAILYTAFHFFNFVLMGSWIIAFSVNYKAFQVTELGPSTQATLNRHRQVLKRVHPYLMLWLYILLAVDSFGLAINAYYYRCLYAVSPLVNQVFSDVGLVFVDYLSLVIYPILFSGFMTEKPLRAVQSLSSTTYSAISGPTSFSVQPEGQNLITAKVGLYLMLFVIHAIFYLAYWIIDLQVLFNGFSAEEGEFYKSFIFFFTALNCLNFWVLAAWISTFVVGHFRGASIREALFENFAFFLLLHYLLFTDAIGVALDAYQYNRINSANKFEFVVDFFFAAIDLLCIVFYPTVLESFFPIVGHND